VHQYRDRLPLNAQDIPIITLDEARMEFQAYPKKSIYGGFYYDYTNITYKLGRDAINMSMLADQIVDKRLKASGRFNGQVRHIHAEWVTHIMPAELELMTRVEDKGQRVFFFVSCESIEKGWLKDTIYSSKYPCDGLAVSYSSWELTHLLPMFKNNVSIVILEEDYE